jgi:glucose-1-phosphatase
MKAIIFDLGNVLIDFDHRIAARRISNFSNRKEEEIFSMFFDSELTGSFEEGRISPGEFFSEVRSLLNLKINYDEFVPIWNEIFFLTKKNREVYYLACRLKKKYTTALLSNINTLHLEYIKKKFPLFDAFHNIITSCELRLRKPQSQIYQKSLEIIGVLAGETFYTDDRPELVESAKTLGINSFVFKDAEHLKNDLRSAGVNLA